LGVQIPCGSRVLTKERFSNNLWEEKGLQKSNYRILNPFSLSIFLQN
jgi:hypothetical protein